MATDAGLIADKIAGARKAGYTDDQIVSYLSKDPTYGPAFTAAASHGYKSTDILDHFHQAEDPTDRANLAPNDELGFEAGGTKVFNNILGAGSAALQKVGVPADAVHAVGSMIRHGPVGAFTGAHLLNADEQAKLQDAAAAQGQRPGKLGMAAGEAVATAPLAIASGALAPEGLGVDAASAGGRALSALSGRGLSGAAVQGAEQGLETSNKGDNLLADAGGGAAGGAILHQGLSGIAGFLNPRFSDAMNTLIDLGQRKFTLGQLSGQPYVQTVEDAARSIPVAGAAVEDAQRASQQDFQRAYLQRAADEAGLNHTVDQPGHQTYQDLSQAFNNGYTNAYSRAQLSADNPLLNDTDTQRTVYQTLRQAGRNDLADAFRGMFQMGYQPYPGGGQVLARGTMTGPQIMDMHQVLDQQANHLLNPGQGVGVSALANTQAGAIRQAQGALDDTLARQMPDVSEQLGNLDRGYAMLSRAREAVTGTPGSPEPGNFTPKALLNKTLQSAGGVNQRAIRGANGTIPGQDIAEAANQVMRNTIGDSGTPLRTAVQRLASSPGDYVGAAGVGEAANLGHALLPAAATAGAIATPYLPGIRDVISNTLVGNSRNPFLTAARNAFDEDTLNKLLKLGINPYVVNQASGDAVASPGAAQQ